MLFPGRSRWWLLLLVSSFAFAQDANSPDPGTAQNPPAPSASEKWDLFVGETFTPVTPAQAVPESIATQLARFTPQYGKHFWRKDAFLKRLGATVADEASRNFFADFALASALHEDTRYVRRGASVRFWPRIGYAISRAVVARTDNGEPTFNWANVIGSAMSAGLSNAYYPDRNRTVSLTAINWGTNIGGAGLSNFLPEFGPDVRHWLKRHLTWHHH